MRLTPEEVAGITTAVAEVFGADASVRLFGSRVDDGLRGGDIDLLVEVPPGREGFGDEVALATALEERLGERRIDALLVAPGRPLKRIEEIAYRNGVPLAAPPGVLPPYRGRFGSGAMARRREIPLADVMAVTRDLSESFRLTVEDLRETMPLSAADLPRLDRRTHRDVLAFLKQFEQLQDHVSRQLIRTVLSEAGMDSARMFAADMFNDMEKAGALADGRRFLEIQRLRNDLAHEYPMDDAERAERIGKAWALAPVLLEETHRLTAYAARYLPRGETP